MNIDFEILKVLSPTDTGENGCHQAGILIPKEDEILSFFPVLNKDTKNPRTVISFKENSGKIWKLNFIYYNNKFFGGTRNEYRLTGTTGYMKQYNLKSGDEMILTKNSAGQYLISSKRNSNAIEPQKSEDNVLRLGNKWRIVSF
jgi:hypothetical protein